MRFAVDAHAIGRKLTGNEVYVRSLLQAFASVDRHSEFIAYVSAQDAEMQVPERFRMRRVAANPFTRLGWDLARLVKLDQPDLIHVQYTAPLKAQVPVVTTVHDVSFLEHPEFFTFARRSQLRLTVARTVKEAARILTVSDFSKRGILRAYDVPPHKVCVVPNAASTAFRVTDRNRAKKAAAKLLSSNAPFVLCVGDLVPRKNHIGLIQAFARLLHNHPHLSQRLVIAGQTTWFASKVKEAAAASGVCSRIQFTGWVSDEELLDLYNACDCFVFPSLFEGFGLPILEAMACGKAVACSNTSAMPEVADGAGITFNPHQPEEIERAMRDYLLDGELRARMERLGLQRSTLFSWRKSATATLDVYKDVVAEHGGSATRGGAMPRRWRSAIPVQQPKR